MEQSFPRLPLELLCPAVNGQVVRRLDGWFAGRCRTHTFHALTECFAHPPVFQQIRALWRCEKVLKDFSQTRRLTIRKTVLDHAIVEVDKQMLAMDGTWEQFGGYGKTFFVQGPDGVSILGGSQKGDGLEWFSTNYGMDSRGRMHRMNHHPW